MLVCFHTNLSKQCNTLLLWDYWFCSDNIAAHCLHRSRVCQDYQEVQHSEIGCGWNLVCSVWAGLQLINNSASMQRARETMASWTGCLTARWIHTEAEQSTSVQNNILWSDETERQKKQVYILIYCHSSYSHGGDSFPKTCSGSISYGFQKVYDELVSQQLSIYKG